MGICIFPLFAMEKLRFYGYYVFFGHFILTLKSGCIGIIFSDICLVNERFYYFIAKGVFQTWEQNLKVFRNRNKNGWNKKVFQECKKSYSFLLE